jgi:hypothetical protein
VTTRMPEKIGQWHIGVRIDGDAGGNAHVFAVVGDDGAEAALKWLRRTEKQRIERFQKEIDFVQSKPNYPGILPIIDADPSEERKWYVMPRAVPLTRYLADATVQAKLDALVSVARTVADLASEEISHRDIKPSNILVFEGRAVLSDFGLVLIPGSEPLTETGEMVGALHFMAPEMRDSPRESSGELADVYSLAKTLWCVLSGKDLPPVGHQTIDDSTAQLSTMVRHPRIGGIERLCEWSTRSYAPERPTAAQFAEELASCAAMSMPEPGHVPDGSELKRRLEAAIQRPAAKRRNQQRRDQARLEAGRRLDVVAAQPVYAELAAIDGLYVQISQSYGFAIGHAFPDLEQPQSGQHGFMVTAAIPLARAPMLLYAGDVRFLPPEGEQVQMALRLSIAQGGQYEEVEFIWSDAATSRVETTGFENVLTSMAAGAVANLHRGLSYLVEVAESQPSTLAD